MTNPVKVIAKAIEQSPWTPGTDGWRDVEARYLARLALSALKEEGLVVSPGWQLIETAPKDETSVVLLFDPNTEDGNGVVFEGQWDDVIEAWFDFCDNFQRAPTHWMPLPRSPEPR